MEFTVNGRCTFAVIFAKINTIGTVVGYSFIGLLIIRGGYILNPLGTCDFLGWTCITIKADIY